MREAMLCVAALAALTLPVLAADPPKDSQPAPAVQSGPPKGFECADKALSGSGPGFKSSQEESAEAATKDWLDKAKAVYADAEWSKAKDARMECVKQGLYSKCFAVGFPCHPKPQ
jgi:hypothetical protein